MHLNTHRRSQSEVRAAPWLIQILQRSPGQTLGVLGLSTVTTVAKLLSIVTGVVAIQTQLTDRSLGGPWAALSALPISGSSSWLFVSFGAAGVAVISERTTQKLRSYAAERTCVDWLRRSLEDLEGAERSLADVGRIARTAVAALLWGTAVAEMGIVLLGLGLIHPAAALIALVSLAIYGLVESRRGNGGELDIEPTPERNHVIDLYAQLLPSLPNCSPSRSLLLEHATSEARVLAPARAYLADQRNKLRQASEAPLVLAVMIGALYLLAVFEGSSDPVDGAASLAISFLLIRILVGSILRMTRAAATLQVLWSSNSGGSPAIDALSERLAVTTGPTAVFGAGLAAVRAALEVALPERQVISLARTEQIKLGLDLTALATDTERFAIALRQLGVEPSTAASTDIGEASLETRLALLLSSQSTEQVVVVVSVVAWLELSEVARAAIVGTTPIVVLVHPTVRSGVPDEVNEVVLVDAGGSIDFHGPVDAYRKARLWERSKTPTDPERTVAEG